MDTLSIILGGIGTAVSLCTLGLIVFKGVLGVESRLTKLETKVELFWDLARKVVVNTLSGRAPGNPISVERWGYLLDRFDSNTLASQEAEELRQVFLERETKAKNERDIATLIAVGLGLALLAILLGRKN